MGTLFVCVCGSFESLLHRQASKRVVQLLAKTNPNTAEKGWRKGNNKGISVLFFVLFSPFLFFMLWHKSTACFVEALFVHGGESHLLQRTFICVLGKRCIGSLSVCK